MAPGEHSRNRRRVSWTEIDVRAEHYGQTDDADSFAVRLLAIPPCGSANGAAAQSLRRTVDRRHVLPAVDYVHAVSRIVFRAASAAAGRGELPHVQASDDAAEVAVRAARVAKLHGRTCTISRNRCSRSCKRILRAAPQRPAGRFRRIRQRRARGTRSSASDIGTIPALLNCARVSAAPKADLTKLGWNGAPPPTLNYTPSLGCTWSCLSGAFGGLELLYALGSIDYRPKRLTQGLGRNGVYRAWLLVVCSTKEHKRDQCVELHG